MISTTTVTAAVSSQRSVARATRQLQEGEVPQVYVTRGDHLLATKSGKTIGEEILDVRNLSSLSLPGVDGFGLFGLV